MGDIFSIFIISGFVLPGCDGFLKKEKRFYDDCKKAANGQRTVASICRLTAFCWIIKRRVSAVTAR